MTKGSQLYLSSRASEKKIKMKDSPSPNPNPKKRKKNHRPESQFRHDLVTCSSSGDLKAALNLYETAISSNLNLSLYHYNCLFHLLSSAIETLEPDSKVEILDSAFKIFDRMNESGITPNEATVTAIARISVQRSDLGGDFAFDLVKSMKNTYNAVPKLRTFGPALHKFCDELEDEKAYEVENCMSSFGILPEVTEITALLKVSAKKGRGEKVYEYLLKLRNCVNCISLQMAEILEEWFKSEKAEELGNGDEEWDPVKAKNVVLMNGGGYFGMGWLGNGRWEVKRGNVDLDGECCCCGWRLACVDAEEKEVEKFVESVARLAMERETNDNFKNFQDWLERHANYEVIIDGANVALYQQNFKDGVFNLSQLDIVVREVYDRCQGKWPLIVLHNKRYQALMEDPSNRQLLDTWDTEGVLYTTPNGSNDDWYWLYAAVKLKCLLVTNDEMRDHIFEILGRSFFPKWKERHQVRFAFVKGNLKLTMPPPYSVVIQESETGSWHVPIDDKCRDESTRTWLCITRPESSKTYEAHLNGRSKLTTEDLHQVEKFTAENMDGNAKKSFLLELCNGASSTGKMAVRSPSPLRELL